MYSVIRWYQGDPTVLAELARRFGESGHEVMATIEGFIAYTAGDDGKGALIAIGTFDDQAGADESNRRAAGWVREKAADLPIEPPALTQGETRLRKVVSTAEPTYLVVRRYQVDPGNLDEIARRAEEGFLPLISQAPGLAIYAVVTGENGEVATTSSFATREQAESSAALTASWAQENLASLVPSPPQVTSVEIKVNWRK
jgi:hypothetical protein